VTVKNYGTSARIVSTIPRMLTGLWILAAEGAFTFKFVPSQAKLSETPFHQLSTSNLWIGTLLLIAYASSVYFDLNDLWKTKLPIIAMILTLHYVVDLYRLRNHDDIGPCFTVFIVYCIVLILWILFYRRHYPQKKTE